MNYLTKLILTTLLGLSTITLCGQVIDSTIVLVTGVYNYEVQPTKLTMEFSLEENGRSCGPNSQFSSIDDQYYYLLDSIKNNSKLTEKITELDLLKNYSSQNPRRTYSFESDNLEDYKTLRKHAEYAFADGFQYFRHYEEPKLEDQDKVAIKALEDAEEKVKEIVKNTKAKSYKLIAIDDSTDGGYSRGLRRKSEPTKVSASYDRMATSKSYYLYVYYKIE